jgi:preprotein translocase subunit SecF
MLLHLVPDNTNIKFMSVRFYAFMLSLIMVLGSLVLIPVRGLNFGIDFQGGILIEIETPQPVDIGGIRTTLSGLDLGDVQVQEFGASNIALIRVEGASGEGDAVERAQQAASDTVQSALRESLGDFEVRRVEVVGPKVSGELFQAGLTALGVALFFMLVYIWFRFEWQFSVGAVVALIHDVIITIGMFSLLQMEFNLSTIAALLTIVGYSMNDTVVVYDRIREKLRKFKKMPLLELMDLALNKTLSRTLLTSGTTLMALFCIFFFGGEVLRGFSFAMIWGIGIGTYSSIFVASALLIYTGVRRENDDTPAMAQPSQP